MCVYIAARKRREENPEKERKYQARTKFQQRWLNSHPETDFLCISGYEVRESILQPLLSLEANYLYTIYNLLFDRSGVFHDLEATDCIEKRLREIASKLTPRRFEHKGTCVEFLMI
jgi:hypothetical protein